MDASSSLEEGFEQTGPYEPITTRLRNILKDYKEGIGVFKELIQNADDAGARTVRFLVDWRHGPKDKLLSPKMAECQGPALWAYNDAVFTDKDLENINKLAGATKVEDLAKIGRFGLGFNAVYHLTDVPSFVSREYLVIFDPNVNHLGNHIKDRSRPGIRINLARNPRPLTTFEDQFQPYHDIFGCNTQGRESGKFNYNGTLFRFPFRTSREAEETEICRSVYDQKKVKAIVTSLKDSAPLLLLYSQHVQKVELYEISKSSGPKEMKLVLSITKSSPQVIRNESGSKDPFITECSNWWKKEMSSSKAKETSPSRCELAMIDTKVKVSELISCNHELARREYWLVTSCVGTNSSILIASGEEGRREGLLPCAGAAVQLEDMSAVVPSESGEAFCFLPLSIPTGIPIHLNGYFAITNNRIGIWERNTIDRSQPVEVQWNESLMEDALANAYINLLEDVKRLSERGNLLQYDFHALWPRYSDLHSSIWKKLAKSVHAKIVGENMPLLCSDGEWSGIKDGYVLSNQMLMVPEADEILRQLRQRVFLLPLAVRESLETSGFGPILSRRTLSFKSFLQNFFFLNITKITPEQRDSVVCFGLDYILSDDGGEDMRSIEDLFKRNSCITVSEDGRHLAKPCQLINPNGAPAILFSTEDRRFPQGEHFLTENRVYVLERLGMVKDQLSLQEIIGRAESVEQLERTQGFESGQKRVTNLIKYLKENVQKFTAVNTDVLCSTRFLPFMSEPPDEYFLPWKGSQQKKRFVAPNELFLSTDLELVGSSCLIIDDSSRGCGRLGQSVKHFLGFSTRHPSVAMVIQQLDAVIDTPLQTGDDEKYHKVKSVCKRVYKYFEQLVASVVDRKVHKKAAKPRRKSTQNQRNEKKEVDYLVQELRRRPWLFIQGRFVPSNRVAYNWNGNAAPFLYGLPDEYHGKYDNLLRAVEVKQSFDKTDFVEALYELKTSKHGAPVTDEELKLTVSLLSELKAGEEKVGREDDIGVHIGKIPLPDVKKILRRSDELTINLTPWLHDHGEGNSVHPDIPPQLALDLGAKSLQERKLEPYSSTIGTPFGQHEELTDRLANILKGYPCDSGILKELLQNADDAQATEIHFIYDKRRLPHERGVFLENAEEIQGPALCVYNDRPFTETDLAGIQHLGTGSKRNDPGQTGQYGIGFNAVYHLTDCPSLFSNGDTLCFFDPHCWYVPGATKVFPGRKFQPIDAKFMKDYPNLLAGYLGNHLKLKGGTVFRLPLRTSARSRESKIARTDATSIIERLFRSFQLDAKKMLLFLNHLKKITLSVLKEDGQFVQVYQVRSNVSKEDEKKRQELSSMITKFKNKPTGEIPWKGIIYPMIVTDSSNITEKWLIQQGYGSHDGLNDDVPDVHNDGLLPRGGVAALVSSTRASFVGDRPRYLAYCFLPLPACHTSLPVHVNGHFALDTARRSLWRGESANCSFTRWNDFMKSHVLALGYASLLKEARKYIPHCEADSSGKTQGFFPNESTTNEGLSWYHSLFPNLSIVNPSWKVLAVELYRILGMSEAPVLPIVAADEAGDISRPKNLPRRIRTWLSSRQGFFRHGDGMLEETVLPIVEADEDGGVSRQRVKPRLSYQRGFFKDGSGILVEEELSKLLIRIGFPLLLYSPHFIYSGFQEAHTTSRLVTPASVIQFLETTTCEIGALPTKLENTKIGSVSDLKQLVRYCKQEKTFFTLLNDLPLLLTADGQLRMFNERNPVYPSEFSDLIPTKAHLFVHPKFVETMRNYDPKTCHVMRKFGVEALAQFFPEIFPAHLRGIDKHKPWEFPDEGVLSKEWFKRLWDFLQNHAEPVENEKNVSLEPLGEWPIIPTTCGKLVTINNAKTVLDLTESGTETTREKKVRKFLREVQCPSLNKVITLNEQDANTPSSHVSCARYSMGNLSVSDEPRRPRNTKPAVTDPYVSHPHSVPDVLQVLDYIRQTNTLNVSRFSHEEIMEVLQFFQDDYENLEPQNKYNKILKALPMFRTIDGSHISLSSFSSYALVPKGIPLAEIAELQNHTRCLYLHSGVLPVLNVLYQGLGTGTTRSICKFYNEFVLPYFGVFRRDSQIRILTHIKDEVLPFSRDKHILISQMRNIRCIPDEQGDLHKAKEFFDPRNEVCRIVFENTPSQFPPSPFHNEEWLEFLAEIGLQEEVDEDTVIAYLKNISTTLAERAKEGSLPNPDKVKKVMNLIYGYLSGKTACSTEDISSRCSGVCKKMECLREFPCVFIEKDALFVKGQQLSFNVPGKNALNPFLYTVPPEYRIYQHILRRLGATENVTTSQLVNVLEAMKDQCNEEEMDSDDEEKAGISMYLLFESIVDNHREINELESSELFLPSEDKFLIKSDDLICQVPPYHAESVAKFDCHVLLPFTTCGLRKERELNYLNALPERMRPTSFYSLCYEELDPSWENNTCQLGGGDTPCSFIRRFIDKILSKEFQEGIKRLMKHQSSEDTDEITEKSSRFKSVDIPGSRGKIQCMNSIKIHLVDTKTQMEMEGTSKEHPCHVIQESNSWTLYIQHDCNVWGLLAECVNEIIDFYLAEKSLRVLSDMLACEAPANIPSLLDRHNIEKDSSDGRISSATKRLQQETEMWKMARQNDVDETLDDRMGGGGVGGGGGGGGRRGGGGGGFRPSGFRPSGTDYPQPDDPYIPPDPNETDRWLKQCNFELMVAKHLLHSNSQSSAFVQCFLSHQIVEKSLKAALIYATRGLTGEQLRTHKVEQLAVDVTSEMSQMTVTQDIGRLAGQVRNYYLDTRYPNRQPHGVPAEQFSEHQARAAVDAAESLLEDIKTLVNE